MIQYNTNNFFVKILSNDLDLINAAKYEKYILLQMTAKMKTQLQVWIIKFQYMQTTSSLLGGIDTK